MQSHVPAFRRGVAVRLAAKAVARDSRHPLPAPLGDRSRAGPGQAAWLTGALVQDQDGPGDSGAAPSRDRLDVDQ
ncbi:MAG: hypothetical protein RL722_2157 [Pseudomonadota bacterium]|jgi:hypothetical protein